MLDRMDLVVKVGRVEKLSLGELVGESSTTVAARVMEAVRFGAESDGGRIGGEARRVLLDALDKGLVTARGAVRLAGLARTIANLARVERIGEEHLAEAMALRGVW